ncbi:MAG: TetR/AcrR family transcriptional regulator [Rhizobiales bacterium]|nr:TetR/AcrR family transcriptional regulator [Hyphomicrobiales bacterium]
MQPQHQSKTRLLDAALLVFRSRGYAGSTVEDVCAEADLTKGSFFHHFKTKEELAIAAAQHFSDRADALFTHAPYIDLPDPRDRLLAYVDFRIAILKGELRDYTCLLGTLVQETYQTHPAIRAACERHLTTHVDMLARDIAAAKARYAPDAAWTPESLGFHIQATIQGAFILAKAKNGAAVAVQCLAHLRRYLELLLVR